MQLGIGRTVFPKWSAAITLTKDNGVDAGQHAVNAVRSDSMSVRLDESIRAMTSFDHAVAATKELPLSLLSPRARTFYRGLEAARAAVTLLMASDLVPGARQRFGRQMMVASQEAFEQGMRVARGDNSRYGAELGMGWLAASVQDAVSGVTQLTSETALGRQLLAGLDSLHRTVRRRDPINDGALAQVSDLFSKVRAALDSELATAERVAVARPVGVAGDAAAVRTRTDTLLTQVARDAKGLVESAPSESLLDRLASVFK